MSVIISEEKQSDLKSQLQSKENLEQSQSSLDMISDVTVENYTLIKELKNKRSFLFKVGLIFSLYFMILALAAIFLTFEPRASKQIDRTFQLHKSLWGFISMSVIITVFFGFLGRQFSQFVMIAFIVHCLLSFLIVIGCFFRLEELYRSINLPHGHYVVINCICLFIMSVMFTLTTFFKMKKTINGFLISFLFVFIVNIFVIKGIELVWITNPLMWQQILLLVFCHGLFAFYLQMNSYLLIIRRQEKFYTHEYIYCFFTYFTDLFSFFWIDSFKEIHYRTKRALVKKQKVQQKRKTKMLKKKQLEQIRQQQKQENEQIEKSENNSVEIKPKKKIRVTVEQQANKNNLNNNQVDLESRNEKQMIESNI